MPPERYALPGRLIVGTDFFLAFDGPQLYTGSEAAPTFRTGSFTLATLSGGSPIALTIAGSDPSGGAGIQGDLKTFSALGAYGTAVLTSLTAQSTQGVTGVHVVPADFVRAQLDTLVDDVAVDAAKIGMLASAATIETVLAFLDKRQPKFSGR